MRNGQNNNKNRMRGRNRRGHNPMTRVYESNGPDVKIRGTAHHIAEKYAQLARDAQSSGDPVAAEGYLQHAEHYFRLIMAAQVQFAQQNPNQQQQPFQRPDMDGRDDYDDSDDDSGQEQPNGQPFQPAPQQMQRSQHQPQPPNQPQPSVQGYAPRRDEEPRDASLPAFITGGGAPQPQANGGEAEPGDRNDRFGRRRRRFRPRGPNDGEPRAESGDVAANAPDGNLAPKSE